MTESGPTPERTAAEWFIALREEPDDAGLRARFAAWHDSNPHHARAWAQMSETARIIAAAPTQRRTDEPDISRAITAPPRRRADPRRERGTRRPRRIVVAAAAVCTLIAFAPALILRATADHRTGIGQVERIRLADNSTVTLGPDSAVAVGYSRGARGIRLIAGQAMFEVHPDPARPFRVKAGSVTTTVLGTGFEVRMIGTSTSIAVRHGRVQVQSGSHRRDLGKGDWVRIAADGSLTTGMEAPALVGEWQIGRVPVRNRPIAEAIDEMRPWYSGKIILADRQLGEKRVTGTYDFRDPKRSLALIVAPYGARIIQITPWLTIVTAE